jgi:hypothetical protein
MQLARAKTDLAGEEIARRTVLTLAIELGDDSAVSRNEQAVQIVGPACHGLEELAKSGGVKARLGRTARLPAVA